MKVVEKLERIVATIRADAEDDRRIANERLNIAASLELSANHIEDVIVTGDDNERAAYLEILLKECPEACRFVSLVHDAAPGTNYYDLPEGTYTPHSTAPRMKN